MHAVINNPMTRVPSHSGMPSAPDLITHAYQQKAPNP